MYNYNMTGNYLVGFCAAVILTLSACSPGETDAQQEQQASAETVTKAQKKTAYDYSSDWLKIRVIQNADTSAPNLILIPGLASSADVWKDIIEPLKANYTLHLVDIAGFAGTTPSTKLSEGVLSGLVDDLTGYIQDKKLEHITLIGHSLGGFTALNEAVEHGDLLDKIVIIDSLPFYSAMRDPDINVESVLMQADNMRNQILNMDGENFQKMQAFTVKMLSKNADAQQEILSWSLDTDRATMARALHEVMTTDRRGDIANITTPSFVIYAYDEGMRVPASQIDNVYKSQYAGLKNVQLKRVDGSFHFIMKDQPELFLSTLVNILAQE